MRQHFLLLLLLLTPRLADAAESLGDRISANFFFEASMPLSKDAAVAAGWTLVDSAAAAVEKEAAKQRAQNKKNGGY